MHAGDAVLSGWFVNKKRTVHLALSQHFGSVGYNIAQSYYKKYKYKFSVKKWISSGFNPFVECLLTLTANFHAIYESIFSSLQLIYNSINQGDINTYVKWLGKHFEFCYSPFSLFLCLWHFKQQNSNPKFLCFVKQQSKHWNPET